MTKKEALAVERAEAKARILGYLHDAYTFEFPPKVGKQEGRPYPRESVRPTVHLVLRHTSRSGMFRVFDPIIVGANGQTWHIGYNVATVLGRRYSERWGGVECHGCGMDMGFDLVYSLSMALFTPEGERYSADAAYFLENRWL